MTAPKATIIPPTTKKRTATEAGLVPPTIKKKKAPFPTTNTVPSRKPAKKSKIAPRSTVRTNRFFALPAELRNAIYDFLGILPGAGGIDIQVTSLMQQDSRRTGLYHTSLGRGVPIVSLMCTSRQFHGELVRILYGGKIRVQGQAWARWMPGNLTAQHLRHLTLQFSDIGRIPIYEWIRLANAKFLDTLRLEISPNKLGTSAKDIANNMKPWCERFLKARNGTNSKRVLDVLQFVATKGSTKSEYRKVKAFGTEVKLELQKAIKSMKKKGIIG